MKEKDFSATFLVDQTPEEVFTAINNPRAWWSQSIEGVTDQLNSIYNYHYKDVHACRIKVIELVPEQKVVWHVLDNYFNFTTDKSEWIDTKMIFEIAKSGRRRNCASPTRASYLIMNATKCATKPGRTL